MVSCRGIPWLQEVLLEAGSNATSLKNCCIGRLQAPYANDNKQIKKVKELSKKDADRHVNMLVRRILHITIYIYIISDPATLVNLLESSCHNQTVSQDLE